MVSLQELETSDNPTLQLSGADPTLFAAAYKKNRFYLFTRREPDEGRWVGWGGAGQGRAGLGEGWSVE